MAIFRREDKQLPILTQVIQVNTEDAQELAALHEIITGMTPETVAAIVTGTKDKDEQGNTNVLEHLPEVCRFTRKIVQDLHSQGGLTEFALAAVSSFAKQFPRESVPIFLRRGGPSASPAHEVLPPQMWEETLMDKTMYACERFIIAALIDLIRTAMQREVLLGECQECQNVFIGGKRGQRFCSKRCQDRNLRRRKYVSAKIRKPSGVFASS